MSRIPDSVKHLTIIKTLANVLEHQGKVRETYSLSLNADFDLLALVASDRLSIFDFVLPFIVPGKGEILTALSHFWFTFVLNEFENHLMPSTLYPATHNMAYDLSKDNPNLPTNRMLVVKRVHIPPFEYIFRGHLGGSVYKKYLKTGMVAGIELPPGIQKWTKMDSPLFTPSTKAKVGHDINISVQQFNQEASQEAQNAVETHKAAYAKAYEHARKVGLLILDTKLEGLLLADEVFTTDSSRYTTIEDWNQAMKEGRDPIFYDKEVARVWGRKLVTPFKNTTGEAIIGLNNLDTENQAHLDYVANLTPPEEVIETIHNRLHEIFRLITGQPLASYQQKYLLAA